MELFCFVNHCFYIAAAKEDDFSNYIPKFILFWGQIKMCNVAGCFETVWERDGKFAFCPLLESIKEFLISEIFLGVFYIHRNNLRLILSLFLELQILHFEFLGKKNHFEFSLCYDFLHAKND